jgi:c(7)-type cytochrome triheme protein
MQRLSSYLTLGAVLVAGCLVGKLALADDAAPPAGGDKDKAAATAPAAAKAPESIKLDKVGKMPPVTFPHAKHGKMFPCEKCHAAKDPLFAQKHSEAGMKMADMYAGKGCGSCHDGKTNFGEGGSKKPIFSAKTCMKCHKASPKPAATAAPAPAAQ